MSKIMSSNITRVSRDQNHSGGKSDPRDRQGPPTRAKGGSTRHRGNQARSQILQSANPVTRRRRNVPRRRFQSFSLTRPTNCERNPWFDPSSWCLLSISSPVLIQSTGAMKCLLDAMLVLTKQDRLCHVIHATSEPFYQTWLRKANVMQHCKVCPLSKASSLCLCTHLGWHSRFSQSGTVPSRKRGLSLEIESFLTYPTNSGWVSHSSNFGMPLVESLLTGKTTSQTTVCFPHAIT